MASAKAPLYPLLFEDLFKEKIWGGRRLETHLGRLLPPAKDIGESWEVSDRDPDISIVANGPLQGRSLHELLVSRRDELLGPGFELGRFERFPILIKFIDADRVLSVQVHPPDDYARKRDPHDDGKTEMWYILAGEPDSILYLGTKPGVSPEEFRHAASTSGVGDMLRKVKVTAGDCISVPPGTLHAPGAGLLFAEVQQNSDLTYRVYDWDRVGPDGKPRELHLHKAMDVIDWQAPKEEKVTPQVLATGAVRKERLLHTAKFTADRWVLSAAVEEPLDGRFRILMGLEGRLGIHWPGDVGPVVLTRGRSVLVPASLGEMELRPRSRAVLLVISRQREGG